MATGASKENQTADSIQNSGGNLVGKAPSAPIRSVPKFQDKSGQGDNQSTSRGKGRT